MDYRTTTLWRLAAAHKCSVLLRCPAGRSEPVALRRLENKKTGAQGAEPRKEKKKENTSIYLVGIL